MQPDPQVKVFKYMLMVNDVSLIEELYLDQTLYLKLGEESTLKLIMASPLLVRASLKIQGDFALEGALSLWPLEKQLELKRLFVFTFLASVRDDTRPRQTVMHLMTTGVPDFLLNNVKPSFFRPGPLFKMPESLARPALVDNSHQEGQ